MVRRCCAGACVRLARLGIEKWYSARCSLIVLDHPPLGKGGCFIRGQQAIGHSFVDAG